MKYWITFNEPNLIVAGYTSTAWAPGYEGTSGVENYIANHNIIRAHGKAYQVYNNTYRATQNGEHTFILYRMSGNYWNTSIYIFVMD